MVNAGGKMLLCSAGGTRIELGLLGEPNPCSALDAGHICGECRR